MSKYLLLFGFLLCGQFTFAQPLSFFISAKPITCSNYTYEIEISQFGSSKSDILFSKLTLDYDDGTNEDIALGDYDYYEDNGGRIETTYVRSHTFPGPGIYTINLRYFNRPPDLQNMSNSVNTPLNTETQIAVDPYLGCNGTPQLENMSFFHKRGTNYIHDFSFFDDENDSLSYQLTTPLQDKNIPVINYWKPRDHDDQLNQDISMISLDPINGSILLNSKSLTKGYAIALNIKEWRKIDGDFHLLSSSTLDFVLQFIETENNPPELSAIQDTAIIAGTGFAQIITVTDPDKDSIQLQCYGDLLSLMNLPPNGGNEFYPGPIENTISFTSTNDHVRSKPYKAVFSANDNSPDYNFLNVNKSMYVWVTDKSHTPEPVQLLDAQGISSGVVALNWIDVQDELGYIIERADLHFPEFERLVILPQNATGFNDVSVVDGTTYRYRIKAVGTKMSAFTTAEVSTTELITSLDIENTKNSCDIYPNPSDGIFVIETTSAIRSIEILDLYGKIVWIQALIHINEKESAVQISTDLSKGVYIMNLYHNQSRQSSKIVIN